MKSNLIKASTLNGYKLDGLDGAFGKVKEFYFDDRFWTIRYLVADTEQWLMARLVLLSPYALGHVDQDEDRIAISLTKKQVEDSPNLDSDKPVSRQFEEDYYGFYGWPSYWGGSCSWGQYPYIARDHGKEPHFEQPERAWDPHLRSTRDVVGHHIQATDGEIGHVVDFVVDDETWAIRYLIVDTRNWWPGKKVLISPQWIDRVSWMESKVFVSLSRDAIRKSPEYNPDTLPDRDLETRLHGHYGKQGYWVDELSWGHTPSR